MTKVVTTQIQEQPTLQTELTPLLKLRNAEETCSRCQPLTPMTCMTRCDVWKLKKEFRKHYERLAAANYNTTLLNTLKNQRRLQILHLLSTCPLSPAQLQQNLKKHGYNHSQITIINEYLEPLVEAGLVEKSPNNFYATLLGCRISELLKGFNGLEKTLQPHSKCYEEAVLQQLLKSPKTYEELKAFAPAESLSRTLGSLQKANLVSKDDRNSYIFYFKTKRSPKQARLSATMQRVYDNIPAEGVTAANLAEQSKITLRRTYKYLRRLKGKKLVFKRKRPKTYALTVEGMRIAELLEKIQMMLTEFAAASREFVEKPSLLMNTEQLCTAKKKPRKTP